MKELEEKFKNMHSLPREERIALKKELHRLKPKFLKNFVPRWWWWWRRCKVKVLVVADGWINFGTTGPFDLSEFLTAFNELEAQTGVNYEVTIAHRSSCIPSTNPVVVNDISNFKFDQNITLSDFDQLWMFAFNAGGSISPSERNKIEAFMDGGGGVFATGDHGNIGNAMCGNIKRVKDMRYWNDFPSGGIDSEVSMGGKRRNDTNQPEAGSSISTQFDNQSDATPQTIAVRTFAAGMPHPLLSIKPSIRPSRIIDIMPDHPHEGECKPETSFAANGINVPTQVIATSFVRGGSTTNGTNPGKDPTDPHCFPSIAVWDGWKANVGRVVVDSTWHHFVNINLDGSGSGGSIGTPNDISGTQSGLTTSDWYAICQYYMNISTWMSRRKFWWCWRRRIIFELLHESQLIEANLENPLESKEKIALSDINNIGALAEEILGARFNPVFARSFLIELVEEMNPSFADALDRWSPLTQNRKKNYNQDWINYNLLLYTAVGSGFLALRDDKSIGDINKVKEKTLEKMDEIFIKGAKEGFNLALRDLQSNINATLKRFK